LESSSKSLNSLPAKVKLALPVKPVTALDASTSSSASFKSLVSVITLYFLIFFFLIINIEIRTQISESYLISICIKCYKNEAIAAFGDYLQNLTLLLQFFVASK
jgi:hypothetical protein